MVSDHQLPKWMVFENKQSNSVHMKNFPIIYEWAVHFEYSKEMTIRRRLLPRALKYRDEVFSMRINPPIGAKKINGQVIKSTCL